MNEDTLEFVISLRGGSEAAAEVSKVTGAVAEAGGTIKRVGDQSGAASVGTGKLSGTIKKLAVAFVALGGGYKVYGAAKNAISYTKELAESSNVLTKATGLNIEESSRYVGVAGALGVSSGQLNMAFKSLATQVSKGGHVTGESAAESRKHAIAKISEKLAVESLDKRLEKGSITAAQYKMEIQKMRLEAQSSGGAAEHTSTAFAKLGISQEWIAKHGKDFNAVILEVTKRLGDMPGSTEKTKIETELFGRSWAALNPLLGEGSEHLEHVLGMAKKFGVELHGGVNKELEQLREAQLESTLASDGLRIAFTKTAAGPMINLLKGFARLKNAARVGNWSLFDKELNKVFNVAGHVIETFEVRSIEGFGQLAPKLLGALWRGFQHASLPNKALMVGIIASKMGLTGSLFGALGSRLGKSLGTKLVGGVAAESVEAGVAGTTLGGLFGAAFLAAALGAGIGYLISKLFPNGITGHPEVKNLHAQAVLAGGGTKGTYLRKNLDGKLEVAPSRGFPHTEAGAVGGPTNKSTIGSRSAPGREVTDIHGRTYYLKPGEHLPPGTVIAHGAFGADVRRSGLMEVGERGPELLNLPTGASVTPLKPGSLSQPIENVLVVDGKVLARVLRRQGLLSQAAGA
jgi:hypothetical protein